MGVESTTFADGREPDDSGNFLCAFAAAFETGFGASGFVTVTGSDRGEATVELDFGAGVAGPDSD